MSISAPSIYMNVLRAGKLIYDDERSTYYQCFDTGVSWDKAVELRTQLGGHLSDCSDEHENSNLEQAVENGDANGDKKVTVSDAVAILQYIANNDKYKLSETGKKNADCSNVGDGITANDALAFQKPDAKMITSLPFSSND